ncbi:hypothetical protein R1flu_010216 [Riccia fluitans]|uniref:tRNA pseudouridine synthase n=1 Tax=Riccia fluitans TaxID=41844 RepID=A0ABD1Z4D5_9MARC
MIKTTSTDAQHVEKIIMSLDKRTWTSEISFLWRVRNTKRVEVASPSPGKRRKLWRRTLKNKHESVNSTKVHPGVHYTNKAASQVRLSPRLESSTFASLGEKENSASVKDGDVQGRDWYKWSMILSYDGTKYSGWQLQPDKLTVQKVVEDALFKITRCSREDLTLTASGRTDAGVHAWGQGPHLIFEVEGTGFFYKQVRNMVGLLLEIGKGIAPAEVVSHILESRKREVLAKYAATAPAHGLYLMRVEYSDALLYPPDFIPKPSYGYRETCS